MSTLKLIDAAQLKAWIDLDDVVIVDVREPLEYDEAHIAGSHLIPIGTLTHDKLPALNGKKLVIHCLFGKRGTNACEKILEVAPELEVYNLEGGLAAWQRAGYKVEQK